MIIDIVKLADAGFDVEVQDMKIEIRPVKPDYTIGQAVFELLGMHTDFRDSEREELADRFAAEVQKLQIWKAL